jgi:formylglycine-generating enzyme required for sulfatase activity/tetratricopeptide (TPR) repeat protein
MTNPINPYIAGAAIRDLSSFYGRQDILEWVEREIRNPGTNALVLFGQRRIGKTSLLLQLQRTLSKNDFSVIYFDLQDQAVQPLGDVLADLAETIVEQMDLDLKLPKRNDFDNKGRVFQNQFLPLIYNKLPESKRLVILLDEFDVFDASTEERLTESAAARILLPFLRRLITHETRLVFIFVAGRRPQDLSINLTQTFKTGLSKEVWVLDRESATDLIKKAEENKTLNFSNQAIKRILDLTGRHPFLVQLLCQCIWNRAYRSNPIKIPMINIDEVNASINDALQAGNSALQWLWGGLNPAERIYAAALAEVTIEGTPISEDKVIRVLYQHSSRLRAHEGMDAPQELIKRRILEKVDGGYRFIVEFFRLWVNQFRNLQEVKDEFDRADEIALQMYKLGESLYRKREWVKAILSFQDALERNPEFFQAQLMLGETLLEIGQYDNAVLQLERAYELDNEANFLLSRALVAQAKEREKNGDLNEAIVVSRRAMDLSPNNSEIKSVYLRIEVLRKEQEGLVCLKENRWLGAVTIFQELLDQNVITDPIKKKQWQQYMDKCRSQLSFLPVYSEGTFFERLKERTSTLAAKVIPNLKKEGSQFIYAGLSFAALVPVLDALRADPYSAAVALGSLGIGLGGSFLADQFKKAAAGSSSEELAREIAEQTNQFPEVVEEMDAVLGKLELVQAAGTRLSEVDRAWFLQTLRDDASRVGSQINIGELILGDKITNFNLIVQSADGTAIDPLALRRSYLTSVFKTVGILQLSGVDPKSASEAQANLSLSAVYTALLTQTIETPIRWSKGRLQKNEDSQIENETLRREGYQLSALDLLNRFHCLVLLGDPGSGKSTFVNFVALCLAGEALGHPEANLKLLTAPLPEDDDERSYRLEKKPEAQPWVYRALLPVRVILREFAARGLPSPGQKVGAKTLWDFIAAELKDSGLEDYAPYLRKELQEKGGILLIDGLDEVPEAGLRRVQIKQCIEDFERNFPICHILVTSRTYAYQKQDWQLEGFNSATLAPFTRGQIRQFVERWYEHIAVIRKLNREDAKGRAELLKKAIFTSDRLFGLAERPLLLTLMASLHAWRGGSLPERREELYADTVDLLMDWWESPKQVRDAAGSLLVQQPSLAEWLKVDKKKVRDLLDEIAFKVHGAQPELTGTADISQAALVNGLMKLAQNPDVNPARLVEYLSNRAGLLLPRGVEVYTFPHRTFQEYLAACYMTEHCEPEEIARYACSDFNRWREVVLLAAAKATRGMATAFWAIVESLCLEDVPAEHCQEKSNLWGAHLAAQALVENIDAAKVSERNQIKVERVRKWLVNILRHGELPVRERALAGDNLGKLGDPRFSRKFWFLPNDDMLGFIEVPAGPFKMGSSDPKENRNANDNEKPYHEVNLPAFYIARYPVSVGQYRAFVEESGYKPQFSGCLLGLANHPVVSVIWHEALKYCDWLTEKLCTDADVPARLAGLINRGGKVTLPSEAEWEKAARGIDGRIYPWGDEFDPEKANMNETGISGTSALGCFPRGVSPYGVLEMSGNVWEWTRSMWGKNPDKPDFRYPYDPIDSKRENLNADTSVYQVLRGGSFRNYKEDVRCAVRVTYAPQDIYGLSGFRVVVLPK